MGGLAELLPRWSPDGATRTNQPIVRREVRRAAQSLQWPALDQAILGTGNDEERHFCVELGIEALASMSEELAQLPVPVELAGVTIVHLGMLLAGEERPTAAEVLSAIDRGLRAAPASLRSAAHALLVWNARAKGLAAEQLWSHVGIERSGASASTRVLSHMLAALDRYPVLPETELVSLARYWIQEADEGTERPLLLVEAHVRHHRRLAEKDEALGLLYFVEEAVQFDIVEALKRSLLSPRYALSPWSDRWRSLCAYALYLMGDYRRAREHFSALNEIPEGAPWCFLGTDPQAQFRHAKEIVCRGR